MTRFFPGLVLVSLLVAGSLFLHTSGRADEKAEAIKLDALKTDLVQKIVKSHLDGAYSKDMAKMAHVKALNEVLGGTAGIPGKLGYEYRDKKPVVSFDARTMKPATSADRDRALTALRDLVSASFTRVATAGFDDGGKKYSLAAGDARAIGDGVRILFAAAPPVDPLRPLQARIDQLAKDLAALRELEKRVGGAEKSLKELEALKKSLDELGKQVKPLPGRLDKVEAGIKPLPGQVKGLADRLARIEKTLDGLDPRLKKLEEEVKKGSAAQADRFKALEEQLKKEREEREKAIKKVEDDAKKASPGSLLPGGHYLHQDDHFSCGDHHGGEGYNILIPAMGTGCFGEHFPVLGMHFIPCPMHGWGHHDLPHAETPYQLPAPTTPKDGKSIEKKDGKAIEKKDGKSIEKKEEEELLAPPFHQLMSRNSPPRTDRLSREMAKTRKVKRGAARPIDLRGLSARDAEPFFWKGYRLYWESKIDEAHRLFEAATQLHDQDARFWYFRSLAESALGQTRQAETSLKQAVDLHLRGLPGQEAISKVLERVQGEARMQFRQALEAERTMR